MTRALLVIDVQESFRQRPDWAAVSDPDIAGKVARLADHARDRGDLVVWILHTEPGTGSVFDPAAGHVRPMAGLAPRDGEPVLTKTSHNAFTTTNLQQLLTSRAVTELAVCGIRTEQCCETTARLASDLGYRVDFVIDATASQPIAAPSHRPGGDRETGRTGLTAAEVIERTRYVLAGRFATVTTVEEVVGTVTGS